MPENEELLGVVTTCPVCHAQHAMKVNADAYKAWQNRELPIQEAFPDMSVDDREILKTGICPQCWDVMFKV